MNPKFIPSLSAIRTLSYVAIGAILLHASSSFAQSTNYYGNYWTSMSTDITKPVPDRSYFTTTVTPTADGADLGLDIYHGKLNSPVTVVLQVAIDDGAGNVQAIPIQVLSDRVADNPTVYFSHRDYHLDYAQMNAELAKILPAGATHLKIGPGTPMFVLAQFWDYNHQWGGLGRGGLFFMPEHTGSHTSPAGVSNRRATDLDLAFSITTPMVMKYNDAKTNSGLKMSGQIKSRVEGEGKYQVPLDQVDGIRARLFQLANDPAEAAKVVGSDWKIEAEMRYMQKDASGAYLKGPDGLPVPDPQVDTYYDNDHYDAAKKDVAIRYRKTAGNGYGVWNIKPEGGHVTAEGMVYRREFGVDTTDDKPETVKKFADSLDPMNPFRTIREAIPGAVPSDFLKPSVTVTDHRYKFILKHTTGLAIELSLDQVSSQSHRDPSKSASYAQMEMDIEHMATASANVAGVSMQGGGFQQAGGELDPSRKAFSAKLGAKASFEGRPVMHVADDLLSHSPLQQKHKGDFDLAGAVIVKLRDDSLGAHWLPAPQKNSLAVEALGLVSEKDASPSVKRLYRRVAELRKTTSTKIRITSAEKGFAECGLGVFK